MIYPKTPYFKGLDVFWEDGTTFGLV